MKHTPELIVMLTHNDITVPDAAQIFEECKDSKARYWGFKEEGLPLTQMNALFARMRALGKLTVLEVVAYTEEECLRGAAMAAECGCDILAGTLFFDSVNRFCQAHHLKYMPFVGRVSARPSVLHGTIEDMLGEARRYLAEGVYGIDLLGYRYSGDAVALNRAVVSGVEAPVCLAGSTNSFARLNEVKAAAPFAFTVGSAFFEHRFGDTICEQINTVCDYMKE